MLQLMRATRCALVWGAPDDSDRLCHDLQDLQRGQKHAKDAYAPSHGYIAAETQQRTPIRKYER